MTFVDDNRTSIEKIISANSVIDNLLKNRLSMLPQLRNNRTDAVVKLAEKEVQQIKYISDAVNSFLSSANNVHLPIERSVYRAIETDATHLLVTISLGKGDDFKRCIKLDINL